MGLLNRIASTLFSSDNGDRKPNPAVFKTEPDAIYAPVSGEVVSLEEIDDEVISCGLFGKGFGIVPAQGIIYSPVSGRVTATTVTNHAIGLMMTDCVEILIHIGIDTVNMRGNGFTRLVEENQVVEAGTPLIVFDLDKIAAAGLDDVVTVVVTNYSDFSDVESVVESGTLIGGRPLVKIGDPLMVVKR